MIELDFSFEKNPWETLLDGKRPGEKVSAARFLSFLEEESEDTAEDAFFQLDARNLLLDISDLPKATGTGTAAVRLRQEEQLAKAGLQIDSLAENDPLRLYLEEIFLIKEDGDEIQLAEQFLSGNENVADNLTNLGIRRVIELTKEYVGYGVLLMDLIQEGSMGLWQAIQNYSGGDYSAHRDQWIRNAMAKAVSLQSKSSGIFQKMREAMEDYRSVDERLLSELGRNPTVEEIAIEMHMSPEETETVRRMIEDARLVQQANRQPETEETEPEEEQAVEDTAYFQARQRILELLSSLDEKDAKLLTLRFGLDKGLPMTPEETGKQLGLTPEEVVQREANALSMLRNQK